MADDARVTIHLETFQVTVVVSCPCGGAPLLVRPERPTRCACGKTFVISGMTLARSPELTVEIDVGEIVQQRVAPVAAMPTSEDLRRRANGHLRGV